MWAWARGVGKKRFIESVFILMLYFLTLTKFSLTSFQYFLQVGVANKVLFCFFNLTREDGMWQAVNKVEVPD